MGTACASRLQPVELFAEPVIVEEEATPEFADAADDMQSLL